MREIDKQSTLTFAEVATGHAAVIGKLTGKRLDHRTITFAGIEIR
jgi:hypothetical protein